MGSFSLLHWIIALALVGVIFVLPIYFAVRTSKRPTGIGGWLLILAIGQTLAPLRTLSIALNSSDGYEKLVAVTNGPLAVYGEVGLILCFMALQIVVAVYMYRKSRWFPNLFLYQWLEIPVFLILDTGFVSTILNVSVYRLLLPEDLAKTTGAFIAAGVWVLYVFRSKRVRGTFVR